MPSISEEVSENGWLSHVTPDWLKPSKVECSKKLENGFNKGFQINNESGLGNNCLMQCFFHCNQVNRGRNKESRSRKRLTMKVKKSAIYKKNIIINLDDVSYVRCESKKNYIKVLIRIVFNWDLCPILYILGW